MPVTLTITCDDESELFDLLNSIKRNPAKASRYIKKSAGKVTATTATKSKTKKAVVKVTKKTKRVRKTNNLTPLILTAIQDVIKKGKPFRSKDVIGVVMKKNPELNEKSVTTGVIKNLGETKLSWTEVRESVGRPYKLYDPKKK